MANGEGVVEEVLVKGRYDGSEVEKGIPESVDRGVAAAAKPLKDMETKFGRLAKAMKEGGATLQDIGAYFKESGVSADEARAAITSLGVSTSKANTILQEAGYSAKQLGVSTKEAGFSFQSLAQSVQWAIYRFFTALIVYQALRKILRAINETIHTSIRLWREWSQIQQTLKASLEINTRLVGEQVGTLEEWNRWIENMVQTFGGTATMWAKATSLALEFNPALKMTNGQLQDLVKLGMTVAQMWGMYKDEQLDVEQGVKTVIQALEGQEAALLKLGIRQEDLERKAKDLGLVWEELPEFMQRQITLSYILEERYDAIGQAASEAMTDQERMTQKVLGANERLMISWGKIWTRIVDAIRVIRLFVFGPLTWLLSKYFELTEGANNFAISIGEAARSIPILGDALQRLGQILEFLIPGFLETGDAAVKMGTDMEEAATKVNILGRAMGTIRSIISAAKDYIGEATSKIREEIGKLKDLAQPFIDLGRAISDAMLGYFRSAEDAARNFARRMADLTADLARNIARLERRFAARAEELVIKAEERKEEIRKEFKEREEEERDDLHLRLKHMEEDFLLDMKHMREQYEMDIEEAARARDWRAIRTLQRRYGLERKQRTEDYQLSRKQFIESWEQRHKRRKKDLEEELKEVEDNLAKQLEALERERQRELNELKIRAQERRDELRQQYAEELEDLRRNLDRRLADVLTAAVQEGVIRTSEAMKVTQTLGVLYGIDMQNLETMVKHDIEWLETWAEAWGRALRSIATGKAGERMLPKVPITELAQGGMGVATKPTLVKVGEAGPELFTAIPLARGGSVLGGLRNQMGGDFRLTIDGNQMGQWSPNFEQGVTSIVAEIFREAFEE